MCKETLSHHPNIGDGIVLGASGPDKGECQLFSSTDRTSCLLRNVAGSELWPCASAGRSGGRPVTFLSLRGSMVCMM